MLNNKITKVMISGLIAGGLLLSTGGAAMASDYTQVKTTSGVHIKIVNKNDLASIKNLIHRLVDQGVISQKQADRLLSMLSGGNLTRAEKNAIISKIEAMITQRKAELEAGKGMSLRDRQIFMQKGQQYRKDLIQDLEKNGTITKEKADPIIKIFTPENNNPANHGPENLGK